MEGNVNLKQDSQVLMGFKAARRQILCNPQVPILRHIVLETTGECESRVIALSDDLIIGFARADRQ